MNRLAQLLLGAWLGGMAAITFTATRAFQTFEKEAAGTFMGGLFKTVDFFGVATAGFVALVWFRHKPRMIVAVLLVAAALASAFVVNPKIAARIDIDTWHPIATGLWLAMMAGALGLAIAGPPKQRE